jgi:hypothetical protein
LEFSESPAVDHLVAFQDRWKEWGLLSMDFLSPFNRSIDWPKTQSFDASSLVEGVGKRV